MKENMYFTDTKENEINKLAHTLCGVNSDIRICGDNVKNGTMTICKIDELHKVKLKLEALENAMIEVTGLVIH